MITLGVIFIGFNIFCVAVAFYNFYYKRRNLPPGPLPLPILGNLLSIFFNQPGEDFYIRCAKKYGPVFTFWLAEQPVVMCTNYKQIMETFQKDGDTYAGRFNFEEFNYMLKGGTLGVIQTEGDLWRDHRRFALHVFRDLGLGKNVMQEKILTEIQARFETINEEIESGGKDINIIKTLDIAVGSIINAILFNYRFDGEHENEFYILKNKVSNFMKLIGIRFQILNWNPHFFIKLPYFKQLFKEIKETMDDLFSFFTTQIENHRQEIDFDNLGSESNDYVEAFLKEKARRELNREDHNFTIKQLENMCFDMWVAGQETTTTTLSWGIAHIIHNPEVQKKLQAELDAVIGSTDRLINTTDRANLPYTNAVVNESLRIANLLPINVLRRTTKDTTMNGYFLPKGTCIIPQVSAILYNDEYYTNSKKFSPERFLTENGQIAPSNELIPFGVGKRQCLGEPLARLELFLFTANIFNQYQIFPTDELPSLKRMLGGTVQCLPFRCKMKRRYI